MATTRHIPASRRAIGPLFFAAAVFYLGFHAISGDRGLYAWLRESRKLESAKTELAALTKQRSEIEHRVSLMSTNSLDLDLLDEEARRDLGMTSADEVVVYTKSEKQ